MAKIILKLTDDSGVIIRWKVYRDIITPAEWRMVTHDGVNRYVGDRWMDCPERIKIIAENYGMRLTHELT